MSFCYVSSCESDYNTVSEAEEVAGYRSSAKQDLVDHAEACIEEIQARLEEGSTVTSHDLTTAAKSLSNLMRAITSHAQEYELDAEEEYTLDQLYESVKWCVSFLLDPLKLGGGMSKRQILFHAEEELDCALYDFR